MLTKKSSPEGKISAPTENKLCHIHPTKNITLVCVTCELLCCEDCRQHHAGHDIRPCHNDGKLVQVVCRAQAQGFYNALNSLEKVKDAQTDKAAFYKETKTIVQEKFKVLFKKAQELQNDIENQLDEACKGAKQGEAKVDDDINQVDECLNKLNGTRNVRDVGMLLPQAAGNAAILEKLKQDQVKGKDQTFDKPEIEEVLPNINKFDTAFAELADVFKVGLSPAGNPGNAIEYDYTTVTSLGTVAVPHLESVRMCDTDSSEIDQITLYERGGNKLIHFYANSDDFHTTKCDLNLWSCVKFSGNKYVALNINGNNVHLLDSGGNTVDKIFTKGGEDYGLCYYSANKFVKLNRNDEIPCRVTLSVIDVKSGKFKIEHKMTVTTKNKPNYLCAHKDKDTVSMVSNDHLYTLNLKSQLMETHDITQVLDGGRASSIFIDSNDNRLVGDTGGNIHMFDKGINHTIVAKVDGNPYGITIRGNTLFVIASEKIWKFIVQRK